MCEEAEILGRCCPLDGADSSRGLMNGSFGVPRLGVASSVGLESSGKNRIVLFSDVKLELGDWYGVESVGMALLLVEILVVEGGGMGRWALSIGRTTS